MASRLRLSGHDQLQHFVASPAWDDGPLWTESRQLVRKAGRGVRREATGLSNATGWELAAYISNGRGTKLVHEIGSGQAVAGAPGT